MVVQSYSTVSFMYKATLKSLFPVQRVAIIVRRPQIFFFLIDCFLLYRNDVENVGKKKKNVEYMKCTHSALICSPGQWTGNKIIFKGGLTLSQHSNQYRVQDKDTYR